MPQHRHLRNLFDSSNYLMSLSSELYLPVSTIKIFAACALWQDHTDDNGDAMSLEELAARTGVTPSYLSGQLKYLSERYRRDKVGFGLIRKMENPNNGRKKCFRLTPKGEMVVSHLRHLYHREDNLWD